MRIDVYLHVVEDAANEKLDRILAALTELTKETKQMSKELDDLEAQVAATEGVEQSAIVLIQGLAAAVLAAKDDPVKIATITARYQASAASLAAAVAANPLPA